MSQEQSKSRRHGEETVEAEVETDVAERKEAIDEDVDAILEEIDEVLAKWGDKTRGRTKGRRTYIVYAMIQPYPEDGKDK